MDAVIFDVDGTLVDTVDFHAEAWRRTFGHFGHEVDFWAVRSQIGKGGDQLMPVFLSAEEIERRGPKIEQYRKDLFQKEFLPRVTGFPRVRDLFERIRADGVRIALASSAKGDELEAYKKAANIAGLSDVDTSSDDADKSKPHPDIVQAALDKLGVPASRAVVVGDTPYDAEAAHKAGLRMVGVRCGGFPEGDMRAAGADAVFDDPQDLLANWGGWLPGA